MSDLLQHPWVQIAAWALLHFVWQGAAIALAALLALRLARTPASRYALGVAALVLMAVAPVMTAFVLASGADSPFEIVSVNGTTAIAVAMDTGQPPVSTPLVAESSLQISPQLLGFIVAGWLAGLVFFAIRLLGGWVVARRVAKRAVEPVAEDIQRLARALSIRLGVRRVVTILRSPAINVPMVVGWIVPTIVLPIAALSGLSSAQMEALLAHELAHIRRHDYLVNLLQSVLEVALFYHPAVWWLSRQVRAERERCCDDLAVSVCDRLVYASALGDLAALASPRVALAATDGDLLGRVRRILSREEVVMSGRSRWSVVAILGLATAMLVPVSMISAGPAPAPQAQVTQALDGLQAGVGQVSQAQQANAAQVEAMKRLHDELRAKMAELERLLEQTLGSKMKHDMASQEAAFAELMKHAAAEQAKHAEAMKHAMVDEAKMKAMQQQFEQAARGFDTQKMATDFARQMQDQAHAMEAMKHAMAQQQALNAEAVKHAMEQYKAHADAFQNEQRAAQANSARELYQQLLNKRTMLNGQLLDEANAVPVTDEKATVQAGDVLRVTIGGEPDLPQAYKVSTEGTIRLPFLGAIKVLGLTAAQSREAVGRQLTERRLGSASLVQVTIFRPKK